MTTWKQCSITAATVVAWSVMAVADMRPGFEDATVVERSDLIVVGRLDKDSIKYVPHKTPPDSGASWEYHAALVVTEILKGSSKDKQIPIVVHYGLDPLIGGRVVKDNENIGVGGRDPEVPKDRIDIVDTGSSARSFEPVLKDAQKDNIWFLRRLGGEPGPEEGKRPLGIRDPEDLAALKFKGHFEALLSKDADKQLDDLLGGPDPAVVARVLRHFSAQHRTEDAPRIAGLLYSSDETVQALAALSLGEVADVSAVPIFRKALGHANPQVRATACIFLCRFGDTESVPAIGKTLQGLDASLRARVLPNLPRMESRAVVDMLLSELDEHMDDKTPSAAASHAASVEAAKALKTLTGVEFPLDAAQARRRWDEFKGFPDEVLLRKSVLEDVEALTTTLNYDVRWGAYEALGRLGNGHFGSYNAFHSREDAAGRERSQELWRAWAKENVTRTRTEWIYAGFAESGIVLPRPMDAKGIDMLIQVLEYYGNWGEQGRAVAKPKWSIDGGWVKANFHRYNANRLLEQLTGHKVGISPYHPDVRVRSDDLLSRRWAAWWKANRGKAKILPLPMEVRVTREMLDGAPPVRLPPAPLRLSIRQKGEKAGSDDIDDLTVLVEIKNVSPEHVLVERRPSGLRYTWRSGTGVCPGGGLGVGGKKEDYVTLKPGQSITWEQAGAPGANSTRGPASVEDLQYEITYCSAGSQFGLRAWRGTLLSNVMRFGVEASRKQ